jgi:hypothetical protein
MIYKTLCIITAGILLSHVCDKAYPNRTAKSFVIYMIIVLLMIGGIN